MTITQAGAGGSRKPLRLWPGVVAVALQWLVRFGVPVVLPDSMIFALLGGLAGGLVIVVWWVFFSRAPWSERVGAIVLMIVAMFATSRIAHESIATGAQGMLLVILAVPFLSLAFVAWAVASRHLPDGPRRATMAATILLACGMWALVRTGGLTANFDNDLNWRWAKTPEERLLRQAADEPVPLALAAAEIPEPEIPEPEMPEPEIPEEEETVAVPSGEPPALAPAPAAVPAAPVPAAAQALAEWPGFRGPERDGVVRGVRLETDWSASPPVELWRRPIGPGWSSFAVRGELLYTQEQRGDDEVVASYQVATGKPVWLHQDAARFWESNGGAGPRGTPTLDGGRVYTLGATGILNVLEAGSGAVVWSRNAASDSGAKIPIWGFSGSPLVIDDTVIVATAGRLAAYDVTSGEPRWIGPAGGDGYSSPHRLTINGVAQVLLVSGAGLAAVAPAGGELLWEHAWPGYPIVQPAQTADGDVLISVSERSGLRRLAVARTPGGWTVEERWTSLGLKPYFNDFVVHDGHAFGFDGHILSCVDLGDGTRKWKGGRYGQGQLVLLSDQNVLLVLSEEGELALVGAGSDQFTELARFPAIEGKTWNHPVLAGDVLLVRNSQEMAAFRLALAGP